MTLNDAARADELLGVVEQIPPGRRSQFLSAQVARFRAQIAARAGDATEAERLFKGAGALFHELETPFHLALTRLEHAEWTDSEEADAHLAEARQIFERLEATPWLARVDGRVRAQVTA